MDAILETLDQAKQVALHHLDGAVYFWSRIVLATGEVIWARDDTEVTVVVSLQNDRFAALIEHYGLFLEVEAYR